MIHCHRGGETRRGMTGLAEITGRDVSNRFTAGIDVVVTGNAGLTGDFGCAVIDHRVGKADGVVAGAAILRGRDVIDALGQADHAVMAGSAGMQ